MFIKVEIQYRQDMVYLEKGVPPTIYSHETLDESHQLLNFIYSSRSNAAAEYLFNLNDIR
jgi:hypothetical protein